MRQLAIVAWAALAFVAPPAFAAAGTLEGTWISTKAEREGVPAADVVGHRLSVAGESFQIHSSEGELLYGGTIESDAEAKPSTIDFQHSQGSLDGQLWMGIYQLDGDTLTIIDNAPDIGKARPTAFETSPGDGYVLVTFERSKP
jgi:uncharacterized protein (TIGR03067 family)